nr:unnamed protein product [Callosobruchus chinensis]
MEMSERDANQLRRSFPTNSVDAIGQDKRRSFNPGKDSTTLPRTSRLTSKNVHGLSQKINQTFCYRCGDNRHLANKCNMVNAICNFCKRKGHLQRVCTRAASNTNEIEEMQDTDAIDEIFQIDEEDFTTLRDKYYISIQVNSEFVTMEVDSGAIS